jgi:hypothetical protein
MHSSKSTSIVAYISVAAGTCLPSRCLVTAVHITVLSAQFQRHLSESRVVFRATENVCVDFNLVITPVGSRRLSDYA